MPLSSLRAACDAAHGKRPLVARTETSEPTTGEPVIVSTVLTAAVLTAASLRWESTAHVYQTCVFGGPYDGLVWHTAQDVREAGDLAIGQAKAEEQHDRAVAFCKGKAGVAVSENS